MDMSTEPFELDLWDWEDAPQGRLFLGIIDTLSDRIAAVLANYGLTYEDVRSGKPIVLPKDATPDARDAVRAAMTLSRASTLTQSCLLNSEPEMAVLLRMAFGELLMAGVLHHGIDPDVLAGLVKDRERQAREEKARRDASRKGKKSAAVRNAIWDDVKAAFDELRRDRPDVQNRKQLERLMWLRYRHLPLVEEPTPNSALYRRIRAWTGPTKETSS